MIMTNRFKGLDLKDRVPDELWMELHDTVQETRIKTISKIMKCKKQRRKGKKYTHLKSEFQNITRLQQNAESIEKQNLDQQREMTW